MTQQNGVPNSPEKSLKKDISRLARVCLASLIISCNICIFVNAGGLFPGGATGITVLIQRIFLVYFGLHVPYTVISICANAFPVYLGFRYIGKKFTLYSLLVILLSGVLVDLLPLAPITDDILLIAVFGGIINGAAISICLSADATSGGTDFIAIYLSQEKGIDGFNAVLGINIGILAVAGILFGWDKALYSIIYQFCSTQVLHVLYRSYQQQTLFIVTNHPNEVCAQIYKDTNHGATILEGQGSYHHDERQLVYSVISASDTSRVLASVRRIDPGAFVNTIRTQQLMGHFYLRPKD